MVLLPPSARCGVFRMAYPRFFIAFLLLVGWAHSQIVISVDSSVTRNVNKSLWGALAFSAVLPGSGQAYLGEGARMRRFAWADAAFWMVCLGSYRVGEQQLSSARDYAVRHAGAVGAPRQADFLDVMANYRSRAGVQFQNSNPDNDEDYNQALIRAGRSVDSEYPNEPGYQWDWGSSDNPETTQRMETYNNMLRNYRISRIFYQISIGALVLNRAVAMFDVLRIYRATSASGFAKSNVQLLPVWAPGVNGAQVLVGF